ncbi:MAG: hypothetical protein IKU01_03450 [Bacteroidales bacterium]|nr:hypothetical protein [Bacteroidales bacterium]
MKKLTLLLTFALAILFTSCQKTKPYNPKEKISKIYTDRGLGKSLSEVWNWDGKQLKTIEYYDIIGGLKYSEVFDYNKKGQVSKVKNYEHDGYTDYIYNKHDRLYQAKLFENGVMIATYTFEYDDNELSEIVLVINDSKSVAAKSIANPLKYVLPELSVVKMDKMLSNALAERGVARFEFDLDWKGGNISELEMEYGNYTEKYYFKYDDKSNPFRNLLGLEVLSGLEDMKIFANKNNVVEVTYLESCAGSFCAYSDTEYISYTYDGKYPVTKSSGDVIEYYEYE